MLNKNGPFHLKFKMLVNFKNFFSNGSHFWANLVNERGKTHSQLHFRPRNTLDFCLLVRIISIPEKSESEILSLHLSQPKMLRYSLNIAYGLSTKNIKQHR